MEQSESKTIISAQSKTNKTVSEAEEKKIVAQMSTVGIAGNIIWKPIIPLPSRS